MADVENTQHTEGWQSLPWKKFERNVRRLQQRIYRAERRGDYKRARNLQRLLLRARSARFLAVRRVTQDNRGKRTPGVDGKASLAPEERVTLSENLRHLNDWKVDPIRRTYIPKPGTLEKRGLGILTMRDRACQALIKLVLEPEWEAKFEPNSYGFRPGRSAQDAIQAIYNHICQKPKYVLDADIEKCFDRIDRKALLKRLNAIQPISRLVKDWLEAGILDQGELLFPEAGVPQGGVVSPLLCNTALHGFETAVGNVSGQYRVSVIRYADDLVVICEDLETLLKARTLAEEWLAEVGLQLKPSKTSVTHTLDEHEGKLGFDFLGFNIRQYRVSKYRTRTYRGRPGFKTLIKPSKKAVKRHLQQIGDSIRRYRGSPQAALIAELNPVIYGWTLYYRTCVAKRVFAKVDHQVYRMLTRWASRRHRNKHWKWRYRRYWHRHEGRIAFSDKNTGLTLHRDTPIKRHAKVRGDKSPYDGDWAYWIQRLGKDPTKPTRFVNLVKRQNGRCAFCGLCLTAEDVVEIHHWDGNRTNNRYTNLGLLHGHCHDQLHGKRY